MAGAEESGDHASGRLRLGRELRIAAEVGGPAAVGIGGPGTRNIFALPSRCRMPFGGLSPALVRLSNASCRQAGSTL
jgi:hypothetical protein